MKFIQKLDQLRNQRLLARNALKQNGTLPFKPESSAKWASIHRCPNGCMLVQIQHDDAANVTPEMLKWWFEHLSCMTDWNGKDFSGPPVSLYHLWHHRDHVSVTPLTDAPDGAKNTGFSVGADTRIHEVFNEFHFTVYARMHTVKLDQSEYTFLIKFGPLTAGHIQHLYSPVDGGSSFYAETKLGLEIPILGWLFNWLVLPFIYNKKTAENWVRHNVEETGRTQDILPILYQNQDHVFYSRDSIEF